MNADHAVITKKLARGGFASPAKFAKDIQTALAACRDYNGDAEDVAEFLQEITELADKVPPTSHQPAPHASQPHMPRAHAARAG